MILEYRIPHGFTGFCAFRQLSHHIKKLRAAVHLVMIFSLEQIVGAYMEVTCHGNDQVDRLILSILVDTFISKISLPMQPVPKIGSISVA